MKNMARGQPSRMWKRSVIIWSGYASATLIIVTDGPKALTSSLWSWKRASDSGRLLLDRYRRVHPLLPGDRTAITSLMRLLPRPLGRKGWTWSQRIRDTSSLSRKSTSRDFRKISEVGSPVRHGQHAARGPDEALATVSRQGAPGVSLPSRARHSAESVCQ